MIEPETIIQIINHKLSINRIIFSFDAYAILTENTTYQNEHILTRSSFSNQD